MESIEREREILISKLESERQMRLEAENMSQEKDAIISSLEAELKEMQTQLLLKIDENSESLRQLTSLLLGKGQMSISETLRDAIVPSLREEFEKQKRDLIASYEQLLAEKEAQLNDYKEEYRRLKGRNDDR